MHRRGVLIVMAIAASMLVAVPSTNATPPSGSPADPVRPIDDPRLLEAMGRSDEAGTDRGVGAPTGRTVSVEVLHDHADDRIVALVGELGGTVVGTAPGSVVQADMPVDRVDQLALADGVEYVRATRTVNTRPAASRYLDAGPVTTEAVALGNAAAWHAAGFTGSGVKVGIIDYFNGTKWTAQVASGEVGPAADTFCRDTVTDNFDDCPGGSIFDPDEEGHGNAVAELIHDLAPNAELYLGRGSSITDTYALLDWFAGHGVRIVNRSLGSPYDGPGDGTGELDTLVDYATTKGITFVNSAGNEGYRQYWRGAWTDTDGDNWMEFGVGDEALDIDTSSTGGCLDILGFRWSDWGDASGRTNYDAYLYDGNVRQYPGVAANQQNGAAPIELDGVTSCGLVDPNLRVFRPSPGTGSSGDVLELLTYQGDLERSQAEYSAGTGIVDSRNRAVLAVGAVDPADSGRIGFYSSQGPTNDGRRKPDVSAPAGLSTSIFGARQFSGTSASAPVVAGLAALVLGANQAATPQGLAALVKHAVVDRGPTGPDSVYGTGEMRLGPPPVGAVNTSPAAFTAITPTRVLDSRSATPNGNATFAGPYEPERIIDLPIATGAPVPVEASAVALNVTVVQAGIASYAQVLPTGFGSIDASSNLNLERAGQTLPNFTIVPLGTGGAISVYAPAGGHLLVDVLGYFVPTAAAAGGRLVPLTPARVLDTRSGGVPRPASSTTVAFPASSGLPASGVSAVVVTVTGTEPTSDGYVTAYPSGAAVPDASTLNLTRGTTNANTAIVPLGPDRTISLYSQSGAHLVVDLQGYFTDSSAPAGTAGRFVPVNPGRIYDTRAGAPMDSGVARSLTVAGTAGIPATGVAAAAFNFTAIDARGANGYLQVWPTDSTPGADFSNLNWSRVGQTIASGGIVKLGTAGRVDIRTFQSAHVAVDVNGYFTT